MVDDIENTSDISIVIGKADNELNFASPVVKGTTYGVCARSASFSCSTSAAN